MSYKLLKTLASKSWENLYIYVKIYVSSKQDDDQILTYSLVWLMLAQIELKSLSS